MADRYKLTGETKIKYGVKLHRVMWIADNREGGWISDSAYLAQKGTAVLYDDVVLFGGEFWGGEFWGGVFRGGVFRGGVFRDGEFWGGEFWGGVFRDGEFRGGVFRGGVFRDGEFWGGVFWGGEFRGGVFRDGVFRGGVFRGGVFHHSPSCAQRSDGYMFVAKHVDGGLRIWAGCRNFSWDEAVSHWNDGHPRGAESQRIIQFLKAQAEAEMARAETTTMED